jgi:membrane associated rhomboid family serine protease
LSLIAAFFTLTNPDALLRWGYIPVPLGMPSAFQRGASALSSLFVHLDPLHLMGNMLFLAAVGPAVERAAGPFRMLLVFFLAGIVGVVAHHFASLTIFPKVSAEPLAGSSAAIAGLIGYAWLRFHRAKVPLLPNLWAPVWIVILVWLALQAAGAWFSSVQFSASTAYFAHLGGFVAGFFLAFPLGAAAGAEDEAWQEHLAAASRRGKGATAAVLKNRMAESGDFAAVAQLAALSEEEGRIPEASDLYVRLVIDSASHRAAAITRLAHLGMLDRVPRQTRFRLARAASEQPAVVALLLESLADEPADAISPSILEALANLDEVDPVRAMDAARRILKDYSLSPEAERIRSKYPGLS